MRGKIWYTILLSDLRFKIEREFIHKLIEKKEVPYSEELDGVRFKLAAPFDFSFLRKYGKVFKVYDDQDSGNICFGVKNGDGKRVFVKFAGAPTVRYTGRKEDAIANLRNASGLYRALAHENLIRLIDSFSVGGGWASVFEWTDAICLGRQYPEQHEVFIKLPVETRLKIYGDILSFQSFAAKKGYVAVDLYDSTVLYDVQNQRTVLCDIDFYRKMPTVNDMGQMWGSSRFMSPEEYELGAVLDEVTNVYTLGAMAFALFAACDRREEMWTLSPKLYAVAKKAVSEERSARYESIDALLYAWETARGEEL